MKVYQELGGYQSLKKAFAQKPEEIVAVSYTHLTLPTNREV